MPHTQPFNGPLSGTTRVIRYQKKHSPLTPMRKKDSHGQQGPLHVSSSPLWCFKPARVVRPNQASIQPKYGYATCTQIIKQQQQQLVGWDLTALST